MLASDKPYKGLPMEGAIATWYAKNTARDMRRFQAAARTVAERTPPGGRVLEVAPGPGYLAVQIAQSGRIVTALDISRSFVALTRENAARAGVDVDARHGNASDMPFADASFDFVVCIAAFKNFTDPIGALNEIHRVLKPGGEASILDLRKEATLDDIAAEVRDMQLSPLNAMLTRFIFRHTLLKNAYTRADLERMVGASRFVRWDIVPSGIGFDLRLARESASVKTA